MVAKTDYFGSFLDAMKRQSSKPVTTPERASQPSIDPLNEILKALKSGDRSVKDLVGITGNSLSQLLSVVTQLTELGLVERSNTDMLRLTEKGRELVAVLD
ncbi:MAG TPA: hypothetical protein VN823_18040 [Stellaceae bacterium]|nr:hypothetical protein [Stellaceae bacterium]